MKIYNAEVGSKWHYYPRAFDLSDTRRPNKVYVVMSLNDGRIQFTENNEEYQWSWLPQEFFEKFIRCTPEKNSLTKLKAILAQLSDEGSRSKVQELLVRLEV